MNILIVLTSHDKLGDTGEKTGFWLEEFTAPYYAFIDAGANITLASPKGGQPPLDPRSDAPDSQTETTKRFRSDEKAQGLLSKTVPLASVKQQDFDAIFYAGGHGPLWDLAESETSARLIEAFASTGKIVSAVCHAPGVFRHVKLNGTSLVAGRKVTGFSNSEEAAVKLTDVVPFLVEDELKKLGGHYDKGPDWQSFVLTDGKLITGQNPASSAAVAKAVIQQLK